MRINWIGAEYSELDSYGRFGAYMIRALQALGVEVVPLLSEHTTMPAWMLQQWGVTWDALTISCVAPCYVQSAPSARHWLYSMWETSQLDTDLGQMINECGFERVLVPCHAVAAAYRAGGVTLPIHVLAGGTDPNEFPIAPLRQQPRPYTFLTLADRGTRKGWVEVWNAFYRTFGRATDTPNVRLIIKCRKEGSQQVDLLKEAANRDQRIVFQDEDVTDIAAVYAQADCVVLPSRFEGWGMPHREAAMMGIPVITQQYSGMDDGCTDEWAYTVRDGNIERIADQEGNTMGEWRKVSVGQLAMVMRHCYDHPVVARRKGLAAAYWLREHQTWQHTALNLLALIQAYSTPARATVQTMMATPA